MPPVETFPSVENFDYEAKYNAKPIISPSNYKILRLFLFLYILLRSDYTFHRFYSNFSLPDSSNCLFSYSMIDYPLHVQMYL